MDCQPGPVRAPLPVSQVALQATGLEAPDRLGGPSLARWWACPALLHGAKQRQAGSWQRRTRLLHASQRPAMPAPTWPAMPTLRPCPGPPSPSRRRNARLNAKIDSKAGTVVMQVRAARPGCRAGPAGAGVLGSRGCDLSRPARRGAATTVGRLRAHVPPPPPPAPHPSTHTHTHHMAPHMPPHPLCPLTPCLPHPPTPPHPHCGPRRTRRWARMSSCWSGRAAWACARSTSPTPSSAPCAPPEPCRRQRCRAGRRLRWAVGARAPGLCGQQCVAAGGCVATGSFPLGSPSLLVSTSCSLTHVSMPTELDCNATCAQIQGGRRGFAASINLALWGGGGGCTAGVAAAVCCAGSGTANTDTG